MPSSLFVQNGQPTINSDGSQSVRQVFATGSNQTLVLSQSITSATNFSGSTFEPAGSSFLLSYVFTGQPTAGMGCTASFGLRRSISGVASTFDQVFADGLLQPSSFHTVSGTLVDGIERGTGTVNSAIFTQGFGGPTDGDWFYQPVIKGLGSDKQGSVTITFKKKA